MNCELEVVAATITGGVAFSEEEVEVLEEEEGVGVSTGGGAVGCVTIGAGLGSYKKNNTLCIFPIKILLPLKLKCVSVYTHTCTIHNFIHLKLAINN